MSPSFVEQPYHPEIGKKFHITLEPKINFGSGEITIDEFINNRSEAYYRYVLKTKEKMVRDCLIALGWTPPSVN